MSRELLKQAAEALAMADRTVTTWESAPQYVDLITAIRAHLDAPEQELTTLRAKVEELTQERDILKESAENWRDNLADRDEQLAAMTEERDKVFAELCASQAMVEELTQAVGLATTIKGDMLIRPDDPIGMMQEVCTYVSDVSEQLAAKQKEADAALCEKWGYTTNGNDCAALIRSQKP